MQERREAEGPRRNDDRVREARRRERHRLLRIEKLSRVLAAVTAAWVATDATHHSPNTVTGAALLGAIRGVAFQINRASDQLGSE